MKKITSLVLATLTSCFAFAQDNLFANPDFDTDITGWTVQTGFSGAMNSFAFSSTNQGTSGNPSSGSLEMTVSAISDPVNDGASSIRQELDLSTFLEPSGPTTFSGAIWVSSTTPTPGGNGTDDTVKVQVFSENEGFQGVAFPQQDIPADGAFHRVTFTFDIDTEALDAAFDPTDVRVLFSLADSQGTYGFDNAILIVGELDDLPTLSSNDFSKLKASIYPNPAQSQINIRGDVFEDKASIYDVSGKLISTKAITGTFNSIDISRLVPGLYFLALKGGATYKFVKQ